MITSRSLQTLGILHKHHSGLVQHLRCVSISSALSSSPVLVSSSKDIYTNLALEHWLYNNLKFTKSSGLGSTENDTETFSQPIVLIWTDEPSVVIGRHQNPWVETTLGLVNKLGIKLARRHSGGGCVYHDENNINISIIGQRNLFENRQDNLRFLARVLEDNYGVKFEPNRRHDLIHSESGLKISGSAAKLGRTNCYHHFTLLVDTDKELMQAAIRRNQQDFIRTNSSISTRGEIVNLKELNSDVNVSQVISDLSRAYCKLYAGISEGKSSSASKSVVEADRNDYESLNDIKQNLEDPKWIYGMTPRFKMEQSIDLMDGGARKKAVVTVQINQGKFEAIEIDCDFKSGNPGDIFQQLIGTDFTYKEAMVNTVKILNIDKLDAQADEQLQLPNASEQILTTLLLKMIQEAHF